MRVQDARLEAERGHGDRVLEEAAEVGVVDVARARRAAQRAAEVAVGEHAVEQPPERDVADLTREVLEEAVELVEVAVGDGEERGRVGLLGGRPGDRAQVGLELVAEALDAAGHAHEVAAVEAAGQDVGVAEDAGADRAGLVAELEGQVGRAGAGREPVLA